MKRRNLIAGLGVVAGTGVAFGSGAFTTASAQRQVTIQVADDANSFLGLTPGADNGSFVDDSGDAIVVDLSDGETGVGADTQYTFDGIVQVQNNGPDATFLWTSVSSAAFPDGQLYFYVEDSTTPLTTETAVELASGESVSLGLFVDTTGIEAAEYGPTLTVNAAEEDPAGGSPTPEPPEPELDPVFLDSVSSLLNEAGEPIADGSDVAVFTEPTATNTDADGNGDATPYPDDPDVPGIPVVTLDQNANAGGVVGITGPFVTSDTTFGDYGNEEFLLNVYDELLGGNGTVLHDESHGQFYTLAPNGGDDFQAFADYVEAAGYTYEATDDVAGDLSDADALVVTSPSEAFTDDELDALSSFVADGGVVFLHDQSDFNDFDATANHNAIAEALGVDFRFNDDQVTDDENNAGPPFLPTTANFNAEAYPDFFQSRDGIGVELDPEETYEVDVVEVTDGDTVDAAFSDGTTDTVRIVGIDTPETGDTPERIAEYEGITESQAADLKTLAEDGGSLADTGASEYAADALADETVTLSFDPNEPLRGDFGRLLGFLELPDGSVYNRQIVEDGWARVYSSGFADHDDYWDAEQTAQEKGEGIWQLSDPGSVPESDDEPVSTLFFPEPVAVSGGTTAVESETGEPLAAFDDAANVAVVGGPLIDEGFEPAETGDGEATNEGTQVYPFVTNLLDRLTDNGLERVVIDGGHGQFDADFALSAEDVAYYQRYLEGQPDGTGGDGSVTLAGSNAFGDEAGPQLLAADGSLASDAVIVTTPTESFTDAERATLADFADAGGAVLFAGSAADADALGNVDPLLDELDADVGFTTTAVTDETNNLGGDPTLPTTTAFPGPDELFTAYSTGAEGQLAVAEIVADADGDDLQAPQETVVFENTGDAALDLTGYSVSDETSKSYQFPDGFTLHPDEQVTLFSGEGSDTDTELYWGRTGSAVWNNGGDTVFVSDADGTTVIEKSY